MNLQIALRILLASSVAGCCVATADAQTVDSAFSGTISSFQGNGWDKGDLGQSVTFDVAFDPNSFTQSTKGNFYIVSAPITSASILGGALGSGINLEQNGPGSGSVTGSLNFITNATTTTIVTSANSPSRGFTGDVFGLSYITNGITTTVDLVRNAFVNGIADPRDSGKAFLSNVTLVPGGQAPEIDPASALSALTLLMGGLAVIRGKKFAKARGA